MVVASRSQPVSPVGTGLFAKSIFDMRSLMLRFLLPLFVMISGPVLAQSWQARTNDNGSLLFGSAYTEQIGLTFGCTAPSPQGRPLIETGSHESHRNKPYQFTLMLHDSLFQWAPPYRQDNVTLYLGQQGYRLPPVELDELLGTGVHLSMSGAFVAALLNTPSLILDTGQGKAYDYKIDGLNPALRAAFGYCIARWAQMGHPLPADLSGFVQGVAPAAAPQPAPNWTPAQVPQFLLNELAGACGGAGYTLDHAKGLGAADFDGDGALDYVFSAYGLRCYAGLNPYCGASKCSTSVYLSSRGYREADAWLGSGFSIGVAPNGRPGLRRQNHPSGPLETWNGVTFAPAY